MIYQHCVNVPGVTKGGKSAQINIPTLKNPYIDVYI